MRGSIKQRSPGSWSIILDAGYSDPDPTTGKITRRQKWHTFRGTKKDAEDRLTDLLKTVRDDTYVDVSKLTLGGWLREWWKAKQVQVRPSTKDRFGGILDRDLLPSKLAAIPLQKIRAHHIEAYYAASTVSASTLTLHHTILCQALRKAVRAKLIAANPAADVDHKPRRAKETITEEAQRHAWTATEARTFLAVATAAGPQPAALYATAIDSGARKGELLGLRWSDFDEDTGKIRIVRQLLTPGKTPTFGPTKTGRPRAVSLSAATVALLIAHRKHQRELMMRHRTTYKDLGLMFAKEWTDVRSRIDQLGQPLQANNIGQREFAALITTSGVRRIKWHGMRHTCATLLLQAGTPVHVVAERLGHAQVSMTMEVYAHVLPDMQRDAADTLGALLHGAR